MAQRGYPESHSPKTRNPEFAYKDTITGLLRKKNVTGINSADACRFRGLP